MISTASRNDRLRAASLLASRQRDKTRQLPELHDLPALDEEWKRLTPEARDALSRQVAELETRGVDVLFPDDNRYPRRLREMRGAPSVLFVWGNPMILDEPGVGMCGSRHASDKGLQAARICGLEVAHRGLVIISGYARGVDTETHLAALDAGGRTIIVLAEGILHFRKKRAFSRVGLDPERVLVVSQFPPTQTWNVGAAMSRNGLIAGLGRALVVIEAGETGGTLNAGVRALGLGKPVLALQFVENTPAGNRVLFDKGAMPIRTVAQLGRVIEAIGENASPDVQQLTMLPGLQMIAAPYAAQSFDVMEDVANERVDADSTDHPSRIPQD